MFPRRRKRNVTLDKHLFCRRPARKTRTARSVGTLACGTTKYNTNRKCGKNTRQSPQRKQFGPLSRSFILSRLRQGHVQGHASLVQVYRVPCRGSRTATRARWPTLGHLLGCISLCTPNGRGCRRSETSPRRHTSLLCTQYDGRGCSNQRRKVVARCRLGFSWGCQPLRNE